jgi:hypothetical protein
VLIYDPIFQWEKLNTIELKHISGEEDTPLQCCYPWVFVQKKHVLANNYTFHLLHLETEHVKTVPVELGGDFKTVGMQFSSVFVNFCPFFTYFRSLGIKLLLNP